MSSLTTPCTQRMSRLERLVREFFQQEEAAVLEQLQKRMADREQRIADALGETRKTQADLIREVLEMAPRSMTVRELSQATDLDQGAIRALLYTREEFKQDQAAPPRPARWCVVQSGR